jgi:hypothetical protein
MTYGSYLLLFNLTSVMSGLNIRVMDEIQNDDYASQLRALRFLLGKNFRPISTAALASLSGIDVIAIRGVEASRRMLNDEDRDAIDLRLGARWNPQLRRWVDVENPQIFFSLQRYYAYLDQRKSARIQERKSKIPIGDALDTLLSNLEDEEAVLALCKIHRLLCDIALQKSVPPKALESIQSRSPVLGPKRSPKDKKAIAKALADLEEPAAPAAKRKRPSNSMARPLKLRVSKDSDSGKWRVNARLACHPEGSGNAGSSIP